MAAQELPEDLKKIRQELAKDYPEFRDSISFHAPNHTSVADLPEPDDIVKFQTEDDNPKAKVKGQMSTFTFQEEF